MKGRRPKGQVQADINVTPLVDVVLVLLIIFMVVTPMIAGKMPVEMPPAEHHDRKADDGGDVTVSVTKDGRVYLATTPVPITDLPRAIEEARRGARGRGVYLRGDGDASYGVLREVMEAVHRAHLDDVMLGTVDRKEP